MSLDFDRILVRLGGVVLAGLALAVPAFALTDAVARPGVWAGALGGYLAVLVVIALGVACHRRRPLRASGRRLRTAFDWIAYGHGVIGAMVLGGAMVGALLFTVVGSLLGVERSFATLLVAGLRDGAFYLFIWAPGTAIVGLFVRAHRRFREMSSDGPRS